MLIGGEWGAMNALARGKLMRRLGDLIAENAHLKSTETRYHFGVVVTSGLALSLLYFDRISTLSARIRSGICHSRKASLF